MADSPRLVSTAEVNTYAPYSLTAVLALVIAVLFAVILLLFGGAAMLAGQPFNLPVLLVLPIAAIVLSFAARRQILSSEGTRTGLHLADLAWWIAVAGGGVYAAILMGTAYALRVQAATAFQNWTANLVQVDPFDTKNAATYRALHGMLPPAQQPSYPPTQIDRFQAEKKEELMLFRQMDLVRQVARSKGAITFSVGGLQKWEQDPQQSVSCTLAAVMNSPEGEFQLSVPMVRQQVNGIPTWQIKPGNYIQSSRFTRYGQMLRDLEMSASAFVITQVLPVFAQQSFSPTVIMELTRPLPNWGLREKTELESFCRAVALGGIGWVKPSPPDSERQLVQDIFSSGEQSRDAIARQRFLQSLQNGQIVPNGVLTQNQAELNPVTTVTDTRVEVRVPIELKVSPNEQPCRGSAIVVCEEPSILSKLKELKQSASSDSLQPYMPGSATRDPWRLLRIESDMRQLPAPRQMPGEGPGGMPGM